MTASAKFRRLAVAGFATLAVACESFELEAPNAAGVAQDQTRADLSEARRVVALVNSQDAALLLKEKARRRGFVWVQTERLPGLGYYFLEFDAPYGMDTALASEELEKLEPHATADENHLYRLHPSAPEGELPDTAPTSAPSEPEARAPCDEVRAIGMIDGDLALDAPGLAGRNIERQYFAPAAASVSAASHGTAVAELMLQGEGEGERRSLPNLYSAVVFEEARGASTVAALIRALDWLAQSEVQIVNVSLAGPYNKALDRAVQRLAAQEVVIVAAVGNDGPDAPPRYPAAFDDVIAVTAVDVDGEIFARAGRGAHVDFSAIGVDIYVQGAGDGRFVSGTSFAAPLVTRTLSTQILNGGSAKAMREAFAPKAIDLGATGRDPVYGFGLLPTLKACVR